MTIVGIVLLNECECCHRLYPKGKVSNLQWSKSKYCSQKCQRHMWGGMKYGKPKSMALAVVDSNGCLIPAVKKTDEWGYARICMNIKGTIKSVRLHRYALELKLGRKLKEGMIACHRCDNPICIQTNPTDGYPDGHIYEGTHKENSGDRETRHRRRTLYGEEHGKSKISNATATIIKKLLLCDMLTARDIAKIVGTTKCIVDDISSGKSWRHI